MLVFILTWRLVVGISDFNSYPKKQKHFFEIKPCVKTQKLRKTAFFQELLIGAFFLFFPPNVLLLKTFSFVNEIKLEKSVTWKHELVGDQHRGPVQYLVWFVVKDEVSYFGQTPDYHWKSQQKNKTLKTFFSLFVKEQKKSFPFFVHQNATPREKAKLWKGGVIR